MPSSSSLLLLAPPLNPLVVVVEGKDKVEEEEDTTASGTTTTSSLLAVKHPQTKNNHNPEATSETDDVSATTCTTTTMLPPPSSRKNNEQPSTATEDASYSNGVRRKHFERVVACLLTTTTTTATVTRSATNTDIHDDDQVTAKEDDSDAAGLLVVLRPQYVQLPPMVVAKASSHERMDVAPNQEQKEWSTPSPAIDAIDPNNNNNDDDDIRMIQPSWPWDQLPPAARVYGTRTGQLSQALRASRKEDQIRSMLQCILPLISPTIDQKKNNATTTSTCSSSDNDHPRSSSMFTIVDFGGGSGHLSIPLALLRPSCRIVCVDLGKQSLELLHQKAAHCYCHRDSNSVSATTAAEESGDVAEGQSSSLLSPVRTTTNTNTNQTDGNDDPRWRQTAIPNLWTFHGPAQAYHRDGGSNLDDNNNNNNNNNSHPDYPLDMAVALHLCGEATDVVLRLAGERGAVAIVVAPCCVGKLQPKTTTPASSSSKKNFGNCNPYIFQATGQNQPTIQYPQSRAFRTRLTQPADWGALAKAADYSDATEFRTARNAARRTAKALLELDRCLFLQEQYNYQTVLTRMQPWEASPKNDILVAWKRPNSTDNAAALDDPPLPLTSVLDSPIDLECHADIDLTMEHLMLSKKQVAVSDSEKIQNDTVDWTRDEMERTRRQMTEFLDRTRSDPTATLIFPTGMGGRQRKLVHYMAAQMNLAHWCQGLKHAEKTVVVRRKWDKPNLPQQPPPTISTAATGDK